MKSLVRRITEETVMRSTHHGRDRDAENDRDADS